MTAELFLGQGSAPIFLRSKMANRHGLIAGATGTGKTVTLRVIAEQLSKAGVPVFMADIKGDLSGLSQPGKENPKIAERVEALKIQDFKFERFPVTYWDVLSEQGHPIRTTISEMGPLLLGRLLGLNDTQAGVLQIAFKVADENGLLLLDIKDLKAIIQHVAEHADELTIKYGNVSSASVGAIQRAVLVLEEQGGNKFFGEPALNIDDLIQTDGSGKGIINLLAADKLMQSPKLYSTILLWLLSELFERLPEVGDPEKPKLVFFFDEAHLLFSEAPPVLLEKIEQVVRLVRSKGVGVYFVSQNPLDIPDRVLGQLGNRVQHALRAFTPRDQKAVKAAAETFRSDGKVDVEQAITQLQVGEALISVLDEKGTPTIVERALVAPPHSQLEPISPDTRKSVMQTSVVFGVYDKMVDRESAFEILKKRAEESAEAAPAPESGSKRQGIFEAFFKSTARAVGSQIGRQIVRGIMGAITGSTKSGGRKKYY